MCFEEGKGASLEIGYEDGGSVRSLWESAGRSSTLFHRELNQSIHYMAMVAVREFGESAEICGLLI